MSNRCTAHRAETPARIQCRVAVSLSFEPTLADSLAVHNEVSWHSPAAPKPNGRRIYCNTHLPAAHPATGAVTLCIGRVLPALLMIQRLLCVCVSLR